MTEDLVVLGASGGTGREVVREAAARGRAVTAVVRSAAAAEGVPAAGGVRVAIADPLDPDALAPLVGPASAVVSAVGGRPGGPADVCARAAGSALAAMGRAGARRLVAVSATGAFVTGGEGPLVRWLAKPVVARMLRRGFDDVRAMEARIAASDRDWTVVRPPRLTNARGGGYRREMERDVRGGLTISRAGLAAAILDAIDDPATVGHRVCVAGGRP